jgi:hypothetical protein
VELGVVEIALVLAIQNEQPSDTGPDKSGDEMTPNKVAWLSDWRFDHAKEKNSRCAEGGDNCGCMVDITEGCAC